MLGVFKMKTENRILIIPDFMIVLRWIAKKPKCTLTDIHHGTKITYAHLCHMKASFIKKQWLIVQKDNRKNLLTLTQIGYDIADGIEFLFDKLGINDENMLMFRQQQKINKDHDEVVEQAEAADAALG